MIQKSKRKFETRGLNLEVHKQIASKRFWTQRLVVCSLGALLGSLLGRLLALDLTGHWVLLALGFAAGFAFPLASAQPWALGWIRQHIGLSYESALESQPDPYGFYDELQERAKLQLRGLELPQIQAWWLPILLAAMALTLIPLIPKTLSAITTNSTTTSSPSPAQPNQNVTPQNPVTPSQVATHTPPEEADPQQSTSEAQELQGDLAQGSGDATRNNQLADDEALSRFLEELQQQEARSEIQPAISPELQPTQGTGDSSNENEASHPRENTTNPFEQITESEEGDRTTETGQSQTEEQTNQAGEKQSETSDPTETPPNQQESSEPQNQENSMGSSSSPTDEQGQQASREEGEGEGQGLLGSEAGENPEQGLEGESAQAPELLPGQITQGPQNVAGTVRLPNTPDEVAPVSNTLAPSFRPSDEEALTEGKIPLEYQNIIRNYFKY